MAIKRSLVAHPEYAAFVERYSFDLVRFATEVIGLVPTDQQIQMFESVENSGSRTSVASGHGTGKTSGFSIIALWHLLCYYNSNSIISAPKLATVHDGVWKEFADQKNAILSGPHAWIAEFFQIESERVFVVGHKLSWWIVCKTAPRGSPENLAGAHRDWLLWLIDEASGVPDENFGVIGGSLTDARNRIICASQPTRNGGAFYNQHHSLSVGRGGVWNNLTFNSEESPLVSDAFLIEKRREYGGVSDPQYQIKVLGKFPENLVGQLLSRSALEAVIGPKSCIPPGAEFGWVLLVDVGAGEYRDKSVVIVAKVFGNGQPHELDARRVHVDRIPICSNTISETALIGEVMQIAGKLSNCTIVVDGGGIGGPMIKRMNELGLTGVVKVLWGNPCFKKSLKEVFFNQRAQAMVTIARATKAGQLSIDPQAFTDSRFKTEMLDQGSRIPYHFNDKAQYVIESKRSKEWEGLPSPDIWDALSFAYLEDCTYITSDAEVVGQASTRREDAVNSLEAALAAALGEVA